MDTESQSATELPECNNSSATKEVPLCLRFYDFIDQYVKVQLVKDVSYYGFVHSIDPVTKSILLWVPNGDKFKTMLIPGHNVVGLGRKKLPLGDLKPPKRQKDISHEITSQEMKERKSKLIAWFKFNLLPVAESGDNIVVQTVHVLPPYNSSNIYAENPVITSKIKQIMEKMPSDFVSP